MSVLGVYDVTHVARGAAEQGRVRPVCVTGCRERMWIEAAKRYTRQQQVNTEMALTVRCIQLM